MESKMNWLLAAESIQLVDVHDFFGASHQPISWARQFLQLIRQTHHDCIALHLQQRRISSPDFKDRLLT